MDVAAERAYPTAIANSPILPLLLLSLMQQKHSPKTVVHFQQQYDFIIVGAGAAGSVVANRLSEIPCISVLLIEAGKPPPVLTEIPALVKNFFGTDIDWNYWTIPQKHCANGFLNNQVFYTSGKAIGGSSIINEMLYIRGNKYNFDDWAIQGGVGWSAADTRPYFLKLEDNRDPEYVANGHHVVDGPMSVHKPVYAAEFKAPLFEAAEQLGYTVLDSNSYKQTGFFDQQHTLRKGQRCSTAKAYLVPAENRTNLDILPNAFVRKIIFAGRRAIGIEFDHGGRKHIVTARREIIVSAGAIGTPKLLLLSGIGPRGHLEKHKIKVVADLPVGYNCHDHFRTAVPFTLDSSIPNFGQKVMDPKNIQDYFQDRTGPLSSTGIAALAFLNKLSQPKVDYPTNELYFVEVPTLSIKQYRLLPQVYNQYFAPYENSTVLLCLVQSLQPKSRGTVKLHSPNPYHPPLFDPNYFDDPSDLDDIVEGMKTCLKIGSSEPMKKVGMKPFTTLVPGCEKFLINSLLNDEYLKCCARSIMITIHHVVGTARMGDPQHPSTVVDPELRVKGVERLRVVDASIIPIITSGNTYIPTIMIGEKASDMIKSTLTCKTQRAIKDQNELPSSPYFQIRPRSVCPNVIY